MPQHGPTEGETAGRPTNSPTHRRPIQKVIGGFVGQVKPEAAYFYTDHGKRAASVICDMKDSASIPSIVEPFFLGLNAETSLTPVMNLDDLEKGLAAFSG